MATKKNAADPPKPVRTVNGRPIPIEREHLVPYAATDQGVEEANAQPQRVKSTVRVVRDAHFDQQVARMEREVEMGIDPFLEVIEDQRTETDTRYANTDDAYRFLSPNMIKKKGMRGWQFVIDEAGQPITVANLQLAAMPKQLADLRAEKYRMQGADRLRMAKERLVESQERAIREASAVGVFAPLTERDMFEVSDPLDRPVTVGMSRSRGNS